MRFFADNKAGGVVLNTERGILKGKMKAWNVFLESFGSLLPGGIGVYEVADKVRPIFVSPGVFQLCYGFDEAFFEKAQTSAEFLMEEKDALRMKEKVQESVEHGTMLDCTLKYRRTPKHSGWVWVRGKVIAKRGSRAIFIALILDVTKERTAEQELEIQNERYRILEETSNEILFEVNIEEDVMSYSYREMDGNLIRRRVPHYLQGIADNSVVHPDYLDIFRQHLAIAVSKKAEDKLEYLTKISGRGYEWHRIHYCSLADDDGKISRVIGRIQNVHDEVLKRQNNKDSMMFAYSGGNDIRQKICNCLDNSDLEDTHAMAIIAIEHYRRIIEQNGVAWGDAAVRKFMDIVQNIVGDRGIFGRLSDGKLIYFCENMSEEELDERMIKVEKEVGEGEHVVADITMACNIGAVVMHGAADYVTIFQEAEEALHIAKITKDERYVRL